MLNRIKQPIESRSSHFRGYIKKSFGSNSLLVARYRFLKYPCMSSVYDPQREHKQMGYHALRENSAQSRLFFASCGLNQNFSGGQLLVK